MSRAMTGRAGAHVYRRRRAVALAVMAVALVLAALAVGALLGGGDASEQAGGSADTPPPPPELPRGGRTILPTYRVVAYYGAPQDDELGALGIGSPDEAARRLARQAKPYERPSRPVLPAMELIAVIATAAPGPGTLYSAHQEDAVIGKYLRAARRAKALLVLDIQPGRSDFFTETTRLRKWLKEPDVSLALDPEWRVESPDIPGKVIGSVDSREVNATTAWLAQLVERYRLPQKLVVIHQFTDDMVDDTQLKPRKGLSIVLNVDGFGGQNIKRQKYRAFTRQAPRFDHGFKLFYTEDLDLMSPKQVLRLRPRPDIVVYE